MTRQPSKRGSAVRQSKRDKHEPVPMVRKVLADNVRALMPRRYPQLETYTARVIELAKDSKMAKSQLFRILAADQLGCSIDYVEWLASALHVRPADLLTPYFASQVLFRVTESAPLETPDVRGRSRRSA